MAASMLQVSLCSPSPVSNSSARPISISSLLPCGRRPGFRVRSIAIASADASTEASRVVPAITLTDKALEQLKTLRAGGERRDWLLRVGVRQGGCSGMSYVMDFEERTKVRADDSMMEYEGISLVCDPKSLLFLFGMRLDYSDALIGGGFSFSNPNATSTCGCGKSFAA